MRTLPKEGKNIAENVHTPPGTAIHVGERKMETTKLIYTTYNNSEIDRKNLNEIDEFMNDRQENKVKWLNVIGLHDTDLIQELCQDLDVHPLVIEDIVDTGQAIKFEEYGDYLFVNTKSIIFNEEGELDTEQISFLL